MIKAIIFDIGSTITNNDWKGRLEAIRKETGIAIHKDEQVRALTSKASVGKVNFKDVLKLSLDKNENKLPFKKLMQSYEKNYVKYAPINKKMIKLVKDLRKNYKVIALSNTQDLHESLNRKRGVFRYFDRTFLSNRMHLAKPDKKAYLYVLKSLKLKPEQCIFIDDKEENIVSAKKIGIKSIHYTNYQHLMKHLKHLGVEK